MQQLEKTLRALANRRRLAILAYLKKSRDASVIALADALGFSYTATSKHLARLRGANLVVCEQERFEMVYRLAHDRDEIFSVILGRL